MDSVSWLMWTLLLWILGCAYLFELRFSLGSCPGAGLLCHIVALVLAFWGASILFSSTAALIYILNWCCFKRRRVGHTHTHTHTDHEGKQGDRARSEAWGDTNLAGILVSSFQNSKEICFCCFSHPALCYGNPRRLVRVSIRTMLWWLHML